MSNGNTERGMIGDGRCTEYKITAAALSIIERKTTCGFKSEGGDGLLPGRGRQLV